MPEKLSVVLGALAPSIAEQLFKQGMKFEDDEDEDYISDMALCITRLAVSQLLSETEAHKARKRLMKRISAMVVPID